MNEHLEGAFLSLVTILSGLVSLLLSLCLGLASLVGLYRPVNNAVRRPKCIAITGASDGIGRSLAIAYSSRVAAGENTTLFLCGRSMEKLESVRALCEKAAHSNAASFTCNIASVNVADREQVREWLEVCDRKRPIEMAHVVAGVYGGNLSHVQDVHDRSHLMMDVNVQGVVHSVLPLARRMAERRCGQIAIMGSLASMSAVPLMVTYSSTKAFVLRFGQLLRNMVKKDGVGVSVICPGFIDTGMVENIKGLDKSELVGLRKPNELVDVILKGLEEDKAVITFPMFMMIPVWLQYCMPPSVSEWVCCKLLLKKANTLEDCQ
eukprot:Nk52_evm1s478 gene=Nk52_evmTU1s478